MTLRLGGCRVKAHPLFLLMLIVGALTGMGKRLLPTLAALALHEAGHFCAARWLRLRVDEVEFTPLGGLMTIANLEEAPPPRRFLLAAAGPLASLCGAVLAPFLYRQGVLPFDLTGAFIHANLALLVINLLRFFAFRVKIVLAPAFAGLYLVYAAAMQGRHGTAKYVTSLIARRQWLDGQKVLPVETVAAGAGMPVRSLLGKLTPGKYHMIHVLSPDGMTSLGVIEEKAFCEAVLTCHDTCLGRILKETGKENPAGAITLAGGKNA